MSFGKKLMYIGIIMGCALILANLTAIPLLIGCNMWKIDGRFQILNYINWTLYFFFLWMIMANIMFSHVFLEGKGQEVFFFVSAAFMISYIISFILYALTFFKTLTAFSS